MFHSARVKLTGWYLLIIMFVSIMFSVVIYRVLTQELNRFERMQRFHIERVLLVEQFNETKKRIQLFLLLVNSGIFVLAGGLGYFLAGRTLAPIAEMIDEQNRFVADASHELRTPLTSLKSAFEVHLRDKKATMPQTRKLITESIVEVNKLQLLSESLLQLAQFEKPNNHAQFENISLSFVIEQALNKIKPIAEAKHITIKTALKEVRIVGNKYALIDLFVILFDNAVKYSFDAGTVFIEAGGDKKSAHVAVRDHGVGIEKKDLSHIFDRFYRADTARSKSGTSGYGLGLAIAKKIVEEHRGFINATSTPGTGSEFIVRFPAN